MTVRTYTSPQAFKQGLEQRLPNPPESWSVPYAEMVRENDLAWSTLEQLTAATRAFLDPVLTGVRGRWSSAAWVWE